MVKHDSQNIMPRIYQNEQKKKKFKLKKVRRKMTAERKITLMSALILVGFLFCGFVLPGLISLIFHPCNMHSASVSIAYPRTLEIEYRISYDASIIYTFSGSIKVGSHEFFVSFSFTSHTYTKSIELNQLVLESIVMDGSVLITTDGIITKSKDGREMKENVQDAITFRFKPTFNGTIRHEQTDYVEIIINGYVASPFKGYTGNMTLLYDIYVNVTQSEAFGECPAGLNVLSIGIVQSRVHSSSIHYTSGGIQKSMSEDIAILLYARMTYPDISPPLEVVIANITLIFDSGANDFDFTNEICTMIEI